MVNHQNSPLVTIDWVNSHKSDDNIRLVEVDVDTDSYNVAHIEGAVGWNWQTQLQEDLSRDLISKDGLEILLNNSGIHNDTQIILYGDNNNWFAAWAYWQLKYYGHSNVKLMDGGKIKWLSENYPTTSEVPTHSPTNYVAHSPDASIRIYRDQILKDLDKSNIRFVDVRSKEEFNGEFLAPAAFPQEGAQRAGHIPNAKNISWGRAVNEDGTFKSLSELQELYSANDVNSDNAIVTYCRIGERAAHSWFVLTQLLGYENVKNYDGSWTEWGNMIGNPVEK